MTEIKNPLSLKPIAGYTRLYLHNYKTPWGDEVSEIKYGKIERNINELPNYCEYVCTDNKYLGIGMVTIVPVCDATNNSINTDDHIREKQGEQKLLNNDKYQTVPVEILDRLYESEKELERLKQDRQKSVDKVEPKFKVGDCMRTKKEAENGIVNGLPYVVDIKDGFYLCNNEKIDIRNQEEYEFPPMNFISIDDVKQEVQKKIDHINKFLSEDVEDKVIFSTWDANMLGQRRALTEILEFIKRNKMNKS